METKERPWASSPVVPLAARHPMKEYLQQQQVAAMNAESVAKAVQLLTASDLGSHEVTQELAIMLVGMLNDINNALDLVNLCKVEAA